MTSCYFLDSFPGIHWFGHVDVLSSDPYYGLFQLLGYGFCASSMVAIADCTL